MAYLVDFLKCLPSDEQKDAALASPELKEWEKLRQECDIMLKGGYFQGRRGSLSEPERLVAQKERRLLDTVWKKYHSIPSQMRESVLGKKDKNGLVSYKSDITVCDLAWFASSPCAKMTEIREAATKLSYMILPISYVIKSDLCDEIDREEVRIMNIEKYTKQDLYALCPISFYDICQVEEEAEQPEMIFGGELMQTKVLLDTITRIQRNLFAILAGKESDTDIWEIGEGCGCSETELTHLRVLIETIMPIQRSLLEIARKTADMKQWETKMRKNHHNEMVRIVCETSQRLSWSEEARKTLEELYQCVEPWELLEAAVAPDLLIFALPRGTSLIYGDELARVMVDVSINMPTSFYLNRGFEKQDNVGINLQGRKVLNRSFY